MASLVGTLVGAYRVIRQIARGGMGTVWLAEHSTIGRRAAIKVLRADYAVDDGMVKRFFNEARATSLIEHPGIVQVFDFGQLEDGRLYLIMEYLEGETLASRMRREPHFDYGMAAEIGTQLASALAATHQKEIIHRDLKPENVFLCADAALAYGLRVKVLDFGVAKMSGDQGQAHVRTATHMSLGTPRYMAPEQLKLGGKADARTDVYALGCLVYEMCTGHTPFEHVSLEEVVKGHLERPPPTIAAHRAGAPPGLEALVARALAKAPAARYAGMAEVGQELAALRAPGPVAPAPGQAAVRSASFSASSTPPPGATPGPFTVPGASQATWETPPPGSTEELDLEDVVIQPRGEVTQLVRNPTPEKPRWALWAGAAGVLTLGLAALFLLSGPRQPPAATVALPPTPRPAAPVLPSADAVTPPLAAAADAAAAAGDAGTGPAAGSSADAGVASADAGGVTVAAADAGGVSADASADAAVSAHAAGTTADAGGATVDAAGQTAKAPPVVAARPSRRARRVARREVAAASAPRKRRARAARATKAPAVRLAPREPE